MTSYGDELRNYSESAFDTCAMVSQVAIRSLRRSRCPPAFCGLSLAMASQMAISDCQRLSWVPAFAGMTCWGGWLRLLDVNSRDAATAGTDAQNTIILLRPKGGEVARAGLPVRDGWGPSPGAKAPPGAFRAALPAARRGMKMEEAVRIREYETKDAAAVAEIFNRAVADIASASYTPEQIAAWLGGGMEAGETHVRCSDGRAVWVATDDADTAIAFVDLEDDGHIDMLFCQPQWAAHGIASALYAQLEMSARQRGMPRLYVEASEIAKPFFAHKSFALLHRNDVAMDGVAVHNYAMEKRICTLNAT